MGGEGTVGADARPNGTGIVELGLDICSEYEANAREGGASEGFKGTMKEMSTVTKCLL